MSFEQEIRNLLNMWRGKVSVKQSNHRHHLVEFIKDYRVCMTEQEEQTLVIKRVINIITNYPFITIEGKGNNFTIKATVKRDSLMDFKRFCTYLEHLEENKEIQAISQ